MAGLYPEEVISEVLSRTDIVDLVGRYVRLKRAGRGYMGLCPFHKEKSPSFHVSEDKQLYHCFGCSAGGNAIHFVMAAENLDFTDALKYLADSAGIILPEPTGNNNLEKIEFKKKMYQANLLVAAFYRDCLYSEKGEEARAYLEKRGLSPSTVRHFGMGYAPYGALMSFAEEKNIGKDVLLALGLIMRSERGNYVERFRNRLMVPIIDVRKNVIGFGGRALAKDEKAKYMNSPESPIFQKGRELFALNYAKNAKKNYVILCEGYMDVISLHQAGFTSAVASMGTALTSEQARNIKKYANKVYLSYDSDGPGRKAQESAMEIFNPLDIKVKAISLPDCKDPDEYLKKYGAEAFQNVLNKAKSTTDYLIDSLKEKYDIKQIEGKVDFLKEASLVLLKIKNDIEREAYIKKVSDETGISEDSIKSEMMKKDKNMKMREEKKIFSRPVIKENAKNAVDTSLKGLSAEKMLLSLMAKDKRVFSKYRELVKAEDYSDEALRALAKEIYAEAENDKVIEPSVLLLRLSDELSPKAASVFSDDEFSDNLKAASDAYETIKDEEFKALSKKYIEEKNIVKLNELIRENAQRKRKEGL